MNIINLHHVCLVNVTYGMGGQVTFRNATELVAVHKADLSLDYADNALWGSGQTLPDAMVKSVDISMEVSSMSTKILNEFVGFSKVTERDHNDNAVPGIVIGRELNSPSIGLGYILDAKEPAAGDVLGSAYKKEFRWYVITCYKANMKWDGITGQSWKDGEDPGNDNSTVEFKCGSIEDKFHSIAKIVPFDSAEAARLYLFKTLRVPVNVQVEVDPNAEQEEDRIINLPLIGGVRYDLDSIAEYLGEQVMNNRVIQELLVAGIEGGLDYIVPGSGEIAGRLIRPVFGMQAQEENQNPENNQNQQNQGEDNINNEDNPG